MKKTVIASILMGMFFPLQGMAGSLTLSNTFEAGTPAVAAEMNQNFAEVATAVNDNNSRVTNNAGEISNNAVRITSSEADIVTNASGISSNATAIGAAGTVINSNAADISSNAGRITSNEGNISTNATAIGTNATGISANTSAVATNATAVATHDTRIATNESKIASNITNIDTNTTGIAANVTDIAANTTAIATHDTRITTNESEIATNIANIETNTTDVAANFADIAANGVDIATNATNISTNAADIAALQSVSGAVYRWNVFSVNSSVNGWYTNNVYAKPFGGVSPFAWSNNLGATADQMSADKDVLRSTFTRKGYGGNNALIYADEWITTGTNNGNFVVALFRIKNTTASDVDWSPTVHVTAAPLRNERASMAVNGVLAWDSAALNYTVATAPVTPVLTIPANRTSTVIVVSASSPHITVNAAALYTRSTLLAFVEDSLALPAGLEYVDDLDVATGDWTQ